MKKRLLFVITQFYKGGAEVALLNLFRVLPKEEYEIDFLVFDQMPLPNAKSLIPEIPDWINVCNAAEKEGRLAVFVKISFKVYRKLTRHQLYRPAAYSFVKGKRYDAAFSYGEWLSPEFVAKKVNADQKFVWIHADIDKAAYVNDKILFGYDNCYDKYLFVSEHSRRSAERAFPFLTQKSAVVHNICNDTEIREKASEQIPDDRYPAPWLVSVGNLRDEKNYPRQIEVMRLLKEKGIALTWLCIGSTANPFLYKRLTDLIEKYGLQDNFLLLGVKENPYPYMKKAAAVMTLSDHESWSLVITEAKLLGVPVISTPTSGAKEQITDQANGILTSFEPEEIAKEIEHFLADPALQEHIRRNLSGFSTNEAVLQELYAALNTGHSD